MIKSTKTFIVASSLALIMGCVQSKPDGVKDSVTQYMLIELSNPLDMARADEVIFKSNEDLEQLGEIEEGMALCAQIDKEYLITQITPAGLLLLADFEPLEKKSVKILKMPTGAIPQFESRVQAELSIKTGGEWVENIYDGGTFTNVTSVDVPEEHTDHSTYFRYEGPGWESDKVGYRFYLDWRNATDIFGKKTTELVLQDVGKEGFDSYHEMADWGMDILKVGNSLGIGSIGMYNTDGVSRVDSTAGTSCEIVMNGPIKAGVHTEYKGWQVGSGSYDLSSRLFINAGSRLTQHHVTVSPDAPNLCTGIAKHPEAKLVENSADSDGWQYLATFGEQSLAGDNLGLAILYHSASMQRLDEDDLNHTVLLTPEQGSVSYYFLAAWEGEPNGLESADAFKTYLDQLILKLNNPIQID